MSRESHKRYLEQTAIREAQKAFDKSNSDSLSRDTFGQLRIQTVEPWKRILVAVIGLPFLGIGIALICTEPFWAGVVVGVIGLGILALAACGRKKTIDAALDGVDVIHLSTQFFDAF